MRKQSNYIDDEEENNMLNEFPYFNVFFTQVPREHTNPSSLGKRERERDRFIFQSN